MIQKTDFTPEQWKAIRNAPQLVALATAAAGHSGLFGSLAEGMATASTMAEALRGDDMLLKAIFDKDEVRGSQDDIRGMLKAVTDRSALNGTLQSAAAEAVKAALAAYAARGATADADSYRKLISGIADKVANASKEGGFLGFGGERVSEGERQFLAQLKGWVGGTAV